MTDANLALGRLVPRFFPAIFGPKENESLDAAGARRALEELVAQVNAAYGRDDPFDEVVYGFVPL